MNAFKKILQFVLPLLLGGAILYWMYRDFDFRGMGRVMLHEMDWTWMLLSFPFGILAQVFRGWRWRQTLEPVTDDITQTSGLKSQTPDLKSQTSDLRPRTSVYIYAIFVSYAVSLLIPRIGEFTRCGVLKRWEGVSFPKALGTVVTERAVDTLIVMLYSGLILLFAMSTFGTFFRKADASFENILGGFSLTGWIVTFICGLAVLLLLHLLLRHLSIYNKVKTTVSGIWEGVVSLRHVRNLPLYLFFSVGIWVMYFLHYYLTFFCFDFTANLGLGCALVSFVVANFAVIVPTPNGMGPWHFAIKTMLILYGVADEQALWFVLIVHTVQTMLVIVLGLWGWIRLSCLKTNPGSVSHS
jgi:hypothetical protein